jgi:hypothetical protein
MTPITPILETPTGRLAELVHLLSDAPLHQAMTAVADTTAHNAAEDDPWWVVASAMVQLRRRAVDRVRPEPMKVPA